MSKKSKKKGRGGASRVGTPSATSSERSEAAATPPAAAPLGSGRVVRKKVQKPSAKEQAALDKKAARARWSERVTSEGR